MRYFVYALLIITFLTSLVLNDVSMGDAILMLVSYLLLISFAKSSIKDNIARYIYIIVIFASVVIIPSFHWVVIKKYTVTQMEYNALMSFGIKVFFVSIVSILISKIFARRGKIRNVPEYKPKPISKTIVQFFFLFIVGLTMFCYSTGLGKMGHEYVVLPFHLGGVINIFRRFFVPLLFMILMENYILRNKKLPIHYFVWFFLWTLFETIAWMSKGIIITNFLPVLLCLYLYYKPSPKKVVKILLPLTLVFLILFPIIGVLRSESSENTSLLQAYKNSQEDTTDNDYEKDTRTFFLRPFNRFFLTASHYVKDYEYLNNDELFDFSKAPVIVLAGGAAAYQTFTIENYPLGVMHSSGTTGIMDPLLHGGYGLCYVVMFLIALLAAMIDSIFSKRQLSICIILILTLLDFLVGENISSLYSGVTFQTLVARAVAIYIAYRVNFAVRKSRKLGTTPIISTQQ